MSALSCLRRFEVEAPCDAMKIQAQCDALRSMMGKVERKFVSWVMRIEFDNGVGVGVGVGVR